LCNTSDDGLRVLLRKWVPNTRPEVAREKRAPERCRAKKEANMTRSNRGKGGEKPHTDGRNQALSELKVPREFQEMQPL